MTETEARARCPMLVTRPLIEENVPSARHALLEAALAFRRGSRTPARGSCYVDTVGLERLIGDPAAIGRRLRAPARGVGSSARVGLAASRTAARVAAARRRVPVTSSRRGASARCSRARPSPRSTCPDLDGDPRRMGVRTLGELAALPREGLATRLGPAGLAAHDLALGLDHDPFRPWTPPPSGRKRRGSSGRSTRSAPSPVLETVLERLCRRLAARPSPSTR